MTRGYVLDASIIVAILTHEEGAERIEPLLLDADRLVVGAPTVLESTMVIASKIAPDVLPKWLESWSVEVVGFGQKQLAEAVLASGKFGKKRHPAGLNFGDCMAYATAKMAKLPLLYIGEDFGKTDLACVRA